jgi:hypothetical protein
MRLSILAGAFLAMASSVAIAQQAGQQDPYQGTSAPPSDDTIVTTTTPAPKPPAGHPVTAQPAAPQAQAPAPVPQQDQQQAQQPAPDQPAQSAPATAAPGSAQGPPPQPTSVDPAANYPADGTDAGIVVGAPAAPAPAPPQPALAARSYSDDPDGDIVHPRSLQPGELDEGVTIRVKLLDRLSTVDSEKGQPFRCTVASDVLQSGQVLIPAGAEIDGQVVEVSSGHAGGTGTMHLRPETLTMSDGSRYQLHAELSGTPGSKTHVTSEGAVKPDSRWKRDTVEYAGGVGAGAVTGAYLGGPAGALTGGLIGAGVVTTHLLVSHPQATLEPGTTLVFTLIEPLQLTPAPASGN